MKSGLALIPAVIFIGLCPLLSAQEGPYGEFYPPPVTGPEPSGYPGYHEPAPTAMVVEEFGTDGYSAPPVECATSSTPLWKRAWKKVCGNKCPQCHRPEGCPPHSGFYGYHPTQWSRPACPPAHYPVHPAPVVLPAEPPELPPAPEPGPKQEEKSDEKKPPEENKKPEQEQKPGKTPYDEDPAVPPPMPVPAPRPELEVNTVNQDSDFPLVPPLRGPQ